METMPWSRSVDLEGCSGPKRLTAFGWVLPRQRFQQSWTKSSLCFHFEEDFGSPAHGEVNLSHFSRNIISNFDSFSKFWHSGLWGTNISRAGALMDLSSQLQGPGAAGFPVNSTDMDSETAALLRAAIRPLFTTAASWNTLTDALKEKGYRLAFRDGRLCLTDGTTGSRICGLRFLGLDLKDLVQRMGRPIVVARGDHADGDLLSARPNGAANGA